MTEFLLMTLIVCSGPGNFNTSDKSTEFSKEACIKEMIACEKKVKGLYTLQLYKDCFKKKYK